MQLPKFGQPPYTIVLYCCLSRWLSILLVGIDDCIGNAPVSSYMALLDQINYHQSNLHTLFFLSGVSRGQG